MRMRSAAALGAAGVAGCWSVPALAPFVPRLASVLGIRTRLDEPHGIALTFDDGPHIHGTVAVLEELDRVAARATFFLVGEQVNRLPSLAAEIFAAGHEIAVHGYHHRLHLRRTPRALKLDLDRAVAVVAEAAGCSPVAYRPPYGVFSLASLGLLRTRGLRPVLWSRWGRDWSARATPGEIAARVTNDLRAGDVVLLHDADHYSAAGSWRKTVASLPAISESALALGEPLVAVTQST